MWVLDRACAISRKEDGAARYLAGFAIDFTERRRQREALRASDEVFRYATLAAGGMIVELDYLTGHLKRYGGEHLLGYRNGELPVKRELWEAILHPDDLAKFRAHRGEENVSGHTDVIEYRVRHRAGHYLRLRSAGVTMTDHDGRPVRRISFLQQVRTGADAAEGLPSRLPGFHS
jgi:PAS domain-containing protein